MSQQILCDRLKLTRDGTIQDVRLNEGGGLRSVNWSDDAMNFYDLRCSLIDIYDLSNSIC